MGKWDALYDILLDDSIDDRVYRALANTPRRYTLYVLAERQRISLDELADVLTGWIHAGEYRMATPADREQLLVELHERHVPLLRQAGFVHYDERTATLSLGQLSPPVARLLDWAQQNERRNTTGRRN